MPDAANTQIVLELEGLPSERGHVRLQDLLNQLHALKAALDSVDRHVGDTPRAALYYRIVSVTHSSPLTITLEPVAKAKALRKTTVDVKARHDRFFEDLSAVRDNRVIEGMDEDTLEAFKRLTENRGKAFASASVRNHDAKVPLDETFSRNLKIMIQGEMSSYGTLSGRLEAMNVHAQPTFWIYPRIGPRRVYCIIGKSKRQKVLDAGGKLVRVSGKKLFRPTSNYPHRIIVKDFEVINQAPPADLLPLRGSSHNTQDPMDFVTEVRDEWE
jgi:hypothetical protein